MQTKWWRSVLLSFLLVACQPYSPIPPQATPGPATFAVYDDYIARGAAYVDSGDLELAEHAYTQAIAVVPNAPAAYYGRAWVYRAQGDYQRGIEDLNQVIHHVSQTSDSPPDPSLITHLYWVRAEAFEGLGDITGMVADLDRILAIAPWLPHDWAYANLHVHAPRLAEHQAALAAYVATRAVPTTEAKLAQDRGMQLLLKGQFLLSPSALEDAVKEFTTALTADPTLASAYHKRALAQLALVQQQANRYRVTTMESGDGNNVWTLIDNQSGETLQVSDEEYFRLTAEDARIRQAMLDRAQTDLESALALTPNVAEVAHDLGVAHYLHWAVADQIATAGAPGDFVAAGEDMVAAALPYLDQAVKLAPNWVQARFNRGMAYAAWTLQVVQLEDELTPAQNAALDQAVAVILDDARQLIDADPKDPRGYFLRLNAAYSLGSAVETNGAWGLTEEQFGDDYLQTILLSGTFGPLEDPGIVEVLPSGVPQTTGRLTSGRLELLDDAFVYIHRARGFRMQLPSLDSYWADVLDTETAAGTLAVTARDTIDQYDLRIVDPAMPGAQKIFTNTTDLDVTAWISTTMLPFWNQDAIDYHPSIQTPYGKAHVLTVDDTWPVAVLPIDGMMYVFSYSSIGEWPGMSSGVGDGARPLAKLTDFVRGFALLDE